MPLCQRQIARPGARQLARAATRPPQPRLPLNAEFVLEMPTMPAEVKRLMDEFAKNPKYPYTSNDALLIANYYGPLANAAHANGTLRQTFGNGFADNLENHPLRKLSNDIPSVGMPSGQISRGFTLQQPQTADFEAEVQRLHDKFEKDPKYPYTEAEAHTIASYYSTQILAAQANGTLDPKLAAPISLAQNSGSVGPGLAAQLRLAQSSNSSAPGVPLCQVVGDGSVILQEPVFPPGYDKKKAKEIKRIYDAFQKELNYKYKKAEMQTLVDFYGPDMAIEWHKGILFRTKGPDSNASKLLPNTLPYEENYKAVVKHSGVMELIYDPLETSPEARKVLEKLERDRNYNPTPKELRALTLHFGPEIETWGKFDGKKPQKNAEKGTSLQNAKAGGGKALPVMDAMWPAFEARPYKHLKVLDEKEVQTPWSAAKAERDGKVQLKQKEMDIIIRLYACEPPFHRNGCEHLDDNGVAIPGKTQSLFPLTEKEEKMLAVGYHNAQREVAERAGDPVVAARLAKMEKMLDGLVMEDDEEDEEDEDDADLNGEPYDDDEDDEDDNSMKANADEDEEDEDTVTFTREPRVLPEAHQLSTRRLGTGKPMMNVT